MTCCSWPVYVAVSIAALIPVSLPTRSIIAINSGGPTAVAPDGTVFEQDRYYTGGTATDSSKQNSNIQINGTDFPSVYETARMTTGDEIWYSLPIPYNVGDSGHGWDFVLTLKFIELRYNQTGKRQFDINLNGLPVLTGIDIVEEVGKAMAYDEDIEFRVEPMSMLLWVTSVGKMRVRMEQPASFGLTSEIHVGITPQIGSARLCALQVTQGTLDDLQAYRAKGKGGKGGKSKRSKAKKRNPNASDRSYSSGEDGGDHVDFMLNPIGYLLAFMSITAASLYGYKKLDGGGRGPPISAARRQELVENEARKALYSRPLRPGRSSATSNSEEDLVTTRTSSSTRSGRSESPGREIPARPLPKRVALSPEEEAEQAAKRAQKKEKKAKKVEKAREESRKAEQLAVAKAKADRESAKERSASALALLQELEKQQVKAEEEAREARAAAKRVQALAKEREAAKVADADSLKGGGKSGAGKKDSARKGKAKGSQGAGGNHVSPLKAEPPASKNQQQPAKSKPANTSAVPQWAGAEPDRLEFDSLGGGRPAAASVWSTTRLPGMGSRGSPGTDDSPWDTPAGAGSAGGSDGSDDNVAQTEDRVQQISRQIAALERVLNVGGKVGENEGSTNDFGGALEKDDEFMEIADEAAGLLGNDIWAALEDNDDDDDEDDSLEFGGRTRSRLAAAWSPRVADAKNANASSPPSPPPPEKDVDLDDQGTLTSWLVENKLSKFWGALRREGFATLRDLLEVELDDEHLDQLGMSGLQVHLRYHQALARLKSESVSTLSPGSKSAPGPVGGGSSPTGGGGMTRTGSSGSIDFGQRTGSADDLTGMVPGKVDFMGGLGGLQGLNDGLNGMAGNGGFGGLTGEGAPAGAAGESSFWGHKWA